MILAAMALALSAGAAKGEVEVRGDRFYRDGKPIVIRSGEMHYPRVPRAEWGDRMRKARAMGLNTICTYVFWNLHESQPGRFDFRGNLDLAEYIRAAQREGLMVIVRPGPYICTELDFGGFPAWLLKDRAVKVRSREPRYLAAAERYLRRVGREVRPLLARNGGPVIMAQVENEYGSYGADHAYMSWVRDTMRAAGFDCLLFTSDGPGGNLLDGGTLPDLVATVNFGGGAPRAFDELRRRRPGSPRMIGEYWCGWFDHWGKRHHRTSVEAHRKDLEWCLRNEVSFNLYMFHGGTNFGFLAGANGGGAEYQVDTTSYDYDAPLDEAGRPTAKYAAFRETVARETGEPLPPVPPSPPTLAIPEFELSDSRPLLSVASRPLRSESPRTFEDLDQAHGMVWYETELPRGGGDLDIERFGDYVLVFVDGRRVGTLDRRKRERRIRLPDGRRLGLLVEAHARINFGSAIPSERKGIDGAVRLEGRPLLGWVHRRLPLTAPPTGGYARISPAGPAFWRGRFQVRAPGDTFLDMRGWGKGFVWVNGRNLGRYWSIGPQQTLFVPRSWLRPGRNEVIVLDEEPASGRRMLRGLSEPILDALAPALAPPVRAGRLDLAGREPVVIVRLNAGTEWQRVALGGATGRYLVLEAVDGHDGKPFASLAELQATDVNGIPVPRADQRVLWANSEETQGEDGRADNVLDDQPTTFWHTEWDASQPAHPHRLLIDLGRPRTLAELRLLPRQDSANGRIRGVRIYLLDASPLRNP